MVGQQRSTSRNRSALTVLRALPMARLPWLALVISACDTAAPDPTIHFSAPAPSDLPPLVMLSKGATIRHAVTPLRSPISGERFDSLLLRFQSTGDDQATVAWENTAGGKGRHTVQLARDGQPHWYRVVIGDDRTWMDQAVSRIHIDGDARLLSGFVVSMQEPGMTCGIPEALKLDAPDHPPTFIMPGPARWTIKTHIRDDAIFTMGAQAAGPASQVSPTARIQATFAGDGNERSNYIFSVDANAQTFNMDLSHHAGELGHLTIETEPNQDGGWVQITDPVISMAGSVNTAPSILLISIDTLRRDRVGRVTPVLDRLASDGGTTLTAISSAPWTLPAHASLLTGRKPPNHGVVGDTRTLPPNITTLAQHLRQNGYRTLGMVSAPYLDHAFGFDQGFDVYDDHTLHVSRHEESHLAGGVERVVDQAIRWFDEASDAPLFVFLHVWDPHYDYRPPSPHDQTFDPDYSGSASGSFEKLDLSLSAEDLDHVRALYDGEVAWTDASLGRLFEELRSRGKLDKTLVVVTSDHGEEFFEHGSKGHGHTLVPEVLEVPVIIRPPVGVALWEPSDTPEPARLVDVTATLLDLADIDPLPGIDGLPFGASGSPEIAWSVATWGGWTRHACITREWAFLSQDQGKPARLFDRKSDPTWQHDIASKRPGVVRRFEEEWQARLASWPGVHVLATFPDTASLSIALRSEAPLGEAAFVRAGTGSRFSVDEDRLSIEATGTTDSLSIFHFVFDPDYTDDPFTMEFLLDGKPVAMGSITVVPQLNDGSPAEGTSVPKIDHGLVTTDWDARVGTFPGGLPDDERIRNDDRTAIFVGRLGIEGSDENDTGHRLDPSLRNRLESLGYTQ